MVFNAFCTLRLMLLVINTGKNRYLRKQKEGLKTGIYREGEIGTSIHA